MPRPTVLSSHRGPAEKEELKASAARREQLEAQLAAVEEPPPLLHPEMARIYRVKVTELAPALQVWDSRPEVAAALRDLVDTIVLTPDPEGQTLHIELRGSLAASAESHRTNEELAGIRRPLLASIFGGGGVQPPVLAAVVCNCITS